MLQHASRSLQAGVLRLRRQLHAGLLLLPRKVLLPQLAPKTLHLRTIDSADCL